MDVLQLTLDALMVGGVISGALCLSPSTLATGMVLYMYIVSITAMSNPLQRCFG